ncbi:ribosome recycling factor [Candidatus Dependentiae bacterium]|nr:ribosome recycling factor [Candidatus Dependentiae bacterium]
MTKPIGHFEKELSTIRTGRASSALVENIPVECYGQTMPIKNLATISIPDARLITIQPWDKSIIHDIEKGLLTSNFGVTPINDGEVIRLQLPQMSAARREEMVKELGKKAEDGRIGIRNIRKEYHNQIRDTEKKHGISEDFARRLNDTLQKVTDEFIGKIDSMQKKKSGELTLT